MHLKRWYYLYVYDHLYSWWYSIKELGKVFDEIKNPRTWSALFYVMAIYSFITGNRKLFYWSVPLIFLVYVVRQRDTGYYKDNIKEKALRTDNLIILEDIYDKYKRKCHFTEQEPLEFELWKDLEKNKLDSK